MASPMNYSDEFVMIDKVTSPPGPFGGTGVEYVDGAIFNCLMELKSDTQAVIAQRQDNITIYSCLVDKDTSIERNTPFRRISDKKTFRVTSDPSDAEIPDMASFNVKHFTAEQWDIPVE